jgi:hypothetical protein
MILSGTNSPINFAGQSNSIVPVRFSSTANNGTKIVLTFRTATGPDGAIGPQYEALTNGTLGSAGWASFTNLVGDGTVKTLSIPVNGPQLFFRLRVP